MRQLKISKQITNRDTSSMDKYLVEIGRDNLITSEEEVELSKRIREGDQAALKKLVRANLRFVVSVAKQYQNQGLSLPDLINEGNLGLIKAAKRFDETRGFKFISYAVWWIRQCILQSIAEQSRVVRLPLNKIGALNKINKALTSLEQKYEREPTAEEIAAELDFDGEDVKDVMSHGKRAVSIDTPLSEDEDNSGTLVDVYANDDSPGPDRQLNLESLQKEIERVLATLASKEAEVIRLFFGLDGAPPHTLEEIAEKIHLTRERVRQIKEKGIRRMRQATRSRPLRSYLGE